MSKNVEVVKAIVLPDYHSIFCDRITMAAVEKYMEEGKFRRGIQLGDFLNFDSISSHSAKNLRAINATSIMEEYGFCNRTLDRWQKYVPQWDIIEGNHEARILKWIDEHPQARGMLEVPTGLNLQGRGIKWTPFWTEGKKLTIGKANFIHGRYTNAYHPKRHYERYQCNIFFGHTHDVQQYSPALDGPDNTPVSQSLGCLNQYDLDYIAGEPTKWQQAFAEFHFFLDGYFDYKVIRIFKHRFVAPCGTIYDGRKLVKG